jgi:hypothetical protein
VAYRYIEYEVSAMTICKPSGLCSAGLLVVCAAQRKWPDWLVQEGGWQFEGHLEQWVTVTGMLLRDELFWMAEGLDEEQFVGGQEGSV